MHIQHGDARNWSKRGAKRIPHRVKIVGGSDCVSSLPEQKKPSLRAEREAPLRWKSLVDDAPDGVLSTLAVLSKSVFRSHVPLVCSSTERGFCPRTVVQPEIVKASAAALQPAVPVSPGDAAQPTNYGKQRVSSALVVKCSDYAGSFAFSGTAAGAVKPISWVHAV